MKIFFIIILFIPLILHAENSTCYIKSFAWILKTVPSPNNVEDYVKDSNCPLEVQKNIVKIISELSGTSKAKYIEESIHESYGRFVKILPLEITIVDLNSFLIDELKKQNSDLVIKSSQFTNDVRLLHFNQTPKSEIKCIQCLDKSGPGLYELKLNNSSYWVKTSHSYFKKALVAKRNIINDLRALKPQDFEEKIVEVSDPSDLFTESNRLVFYRASRPIESGKPLLISNLVENFVINTGQNVEIIYKSDDLKLSLKGTSLTNAKIGESVTVKSQFSIRHISGKAIDFNKVEIAL